MFCFAQAEFEKRESALLRQMQDKTEEAEAHRADEKRRLQEVVVKTHTDLASVSIMLTASIPNLPLVSPSACLRILDARLFLPITQ